MVTCGTTSFSSGTRFLATACITNSAASVVSHAGAVPPWRNGMNVVLVIWQKEVSFFL
jgi:hypothetical protein